MQHEDIGAINTLATISQAKRLITEIRMAMNKAKEATQEIAVALHQQSQSVMLLRENVDRVSPLSEENGRSFSEINNVIGNLHHMAEG